MYNTVLRLIVKHILICVFHMKKSDRNNILNMHSGVLKTYRAT
jgi:hypothetical protein